jgi:hypothetical protein
VDEAATAKSQGGSSISLLNQSSSVSIIETPYPHVVIRNALKKETYQDLANNYPSTSQIRKSTVVSNRHQIHAKDLLSDSHTYPAWREFAQYHISQSFYLELIHLFAPFIRSTYPWLEDSVGKPLEEFTCGPRDPNLEVQPDISLDCQPGLNTVSNERMSVRTPHLDANNKLITGLFYMRVDGDDSEGGDLELYRPRKKKMRFSTAATPMVEDIEVVTSVPYQANTAVFFLNSPVSVHGVSPRDGTEIPRRLVNLIAGMYAFKEKEFFQKPKVYKPSLFSRVFGKS